MPYRFNGVECDTVEELRALTGYPMNQVLASNKEPEVKMQYSISCNGTRAGHNLDRCTLAMDHIEPCVF